MSKLIALFLFGPFILALGLITKYFPPKKPNNLYGYRTTRSMKNQDVWDFANKFSANTFIVSGIVMTIISLLTWQLNEENFALVNLFSLLFGLVISIYLTERELKKNFDNDGNRKQSN